MQKIKVGILLTFIIALSSCVQKNELVYEEYTFEIQGFTWDPQPYKFSEYIQDSVLSDFGREYAAWDFSYIGDIDNMLRTWDIDASPKDTLSELEISSFRNFSDHDAEPIIIDKSKEAKVVIINEAHQMPQHRVFTTNLLQDLYNVGYRHLGMESFFASKISDSTLIANKYPVLTNGYYTKEPQYGNIIRQAVKIGYKVFGYESQGHSNPAEREIYQAKNIKAYIESNPEGKYLIHCGFAHGAEGIYGGTLEKTMAARLTEFTGIDPLSIDQTIHSEKSNKEYENPYYQLTDVDEPTISMHNDSIFGQYREGTWFDISVFHPRTKNFERPKWLLTGKRTIQSINFKNEEIECPCLVFAYLDNEEVGKAVPYDIQETANKAVKLVLEKGKYNIIILNGENRALKANMDY